MNSSWAWVALGTAAGLAATLTPPATLKSPPRAPATAMEEGMMAWRKPGRIDHAACANCHGPDALDLAIYNFDDDDIRRRALAHLDPLDVDRVLGLIHAVRARYKIIHLLDPQKDRPFQPGGEVLAGDTAEARDIAFGKELSVRLPLLTSGRIESLVQARAAADQVMSVDPWSLKIGIPFNRFSEDVFHGREHASLAHWIPDVPRTVPDENAAEWYALQDAYLADPSDANLWRMYDGFERLTRAPSNMAIASLAAEKYRSLLLMQHFQRKRGAYGNSLAPSLPPVAFGGRSTPMVPSPMWQVGDLARIFQDRNAEAMGVDPELAQKKSGGPSFQRQMVDLQASWFWLGWLFDQGLHRTSFRQMIARGDWLAVALWNAGPYPIHNVYWIARKQLVTNRVPEAWAMQPGRKRPEWDYLAMRIGGAYELNMPEDPTHRAMFEEITANCFRMSLYLMLDEWRTTKIVWYRDYSRDQVRALTDFIAKHDPDWKPQLEALRAELYAAIAACTQKV